MKYHKGFKFVCAERIEFQTNITGFEISEKLTSLNKDGILSVELFFPWDGNSGPFPDLNSTIESSCGHDILCDYINKGLLPAWTQPLVDQFYFDQALRNNLPSWVARQVTLFIRWYMLRKGDNKFFRKTYDSREKNNG